MSIYSELLDAVHNGAKFKVDLKNKSLWINKKQYIREGEIIYGSYYFIKEDDLAPYEYVDKLNEDPWSWIESLYYDYKHSVPSENSNKKSYFKALPVDELKMHELAYNKGRDFCQCMLEGYILLASLQGWLVWEHEEHWFWQKNDLVVLREWIEN
jgi:hypothetical protein